jgi:hypothetical protein
MNTLPDIGFSEELIRRFDKRGPRYTEKEPQVTEKISHPSGQPGAFVLGL